MLSFTDYLAEEKMELIEKLITLGGQAYPNFGNVVIMAGGAGSGKGFIKKNLLGMEGYTFDVDDLKKLAAKAPSIRKRVKAELGVDLEQLAGDLKNPENVSKLHEIIGDFLGIDDRRTKILYRSIMTADPSRKPNLIFDVTLKDLRKLQRLSRQVTQLGYEKKDIHLVWVVNDIEVAKTQNATRDRNVPVEILINTHKGASQTMQDIVTMGDALKTYMDGDIVFAFNKVGVDSDFVKSDKGGGYVKDANYFYIKKAGQPVTPLDKINRDVRAKIAQYVPKNVEWI